jgi:hypothetical protein
MCVSGCLSQQLAGEKFSQDRGDRFCLEDVRLSFKRAVFRVGENSGQGFHAVTHPLWAFAAIHDKRWHSDISPTIGWQGFAKLVGFRDHNVVWKSVGNGFERLPHGKEAHHEDNE